MKFKSSLITSRLDLGYLPYVHRQIPNQTPNSLPTHAKRYASKSQAPFRV